MRILAGIARLLLALNVILITLGASGQPAAPVGLLVNGVNDPLAIDCGSARFTWMSKDDSRGERQTAYQILVASNRADLSAGMGDWWNSGKVDSDRSASVVYAGKVLPPAKRFWWEVRIWDQTGKPSPYSAPAFFDIGLNQNDWTAHYIWDGTTNVNNFAYFRKTFSVTRQPELAKVYVTAHNDYLLYFNGHLLGRGPARCNPYRYGQYNAYDITKLVKTGTNVFAAMGHWQGNWNNSGINAQPAFLLEARLDCPDGSSSTIGTDASWKVLAHTAFIETNATYFGGAGGSRNRAAIQFDSLREPVGWRTVGFDDSNWAYATVVDRSDYHLFAQMAPLEREQAELKPVSITQTNGAWLVDFGRCIDGWPKLTMRENHAGDKVRTEYFQMTGERKPAGWDEYICSPRGIAVAGSGGRSGEDYSTGQGGTEIWDADFGRHTSFQVLKITGYAGELKTSDVRGMWAYCDADVAGRFHCSSELLNNIYKMCERSAQQNVQQGIISVDADREQTSWLADSWNIGNVLLYNDRDTTMIDKTVRDYAGEQLPSGYIPACSPGYRSADNPVSGNISGQIPEWAMYWPILLWQQYLFSDDQTLLREMAPRLTHFLDWLKPFQNPTTKLLNPPGWRISEYAGGNMPSGGYNIATACQYYDNLRIASRIFSVLGQTNQSDEYQQQAKAVKAGINANLFNGEYYLARTDRKEMFSLASAWVLRFNIEPAADKSKILATIEKVGRPNIGGYGGDAFYNGLLNAGGGAFAVRDLARYRPMLDSNKANWESFYLGRKIEVNHAWTSYPGYLFQKYILGIRPTSGGFATFDVRPDTGGLTFAEGTVPTVKGLITTRWEKRADGKFSLLVKVPANTRAAVYIPKLVKGNFVLTESGKVLWPAKSPLKDTGVLTVLDEDSSIKCLVGGGDYRFKETR
jgi:alpha-L-rhamnosidase